VQISEPKRVRWGLKTIVIVGMADSIHVARWVQNMRELEVRVILMSSSPHRRVHPILKNLLSNDPSQRLRISMPSWSKNFSLLLALADLLAGDRIRGLLLARLIARVRPDLVHLLEIQHAGYIYNRGLAFMGSDPPVLAVSNYGSDIYWFGRFESHRRKLRRLLSKTDIYTCECRRDVKLAIDQGLLDRTYHVIPNTGGIDEGVINSGTAFESASSRRLVLIKGYQGIFGRALVALRAVWRIRDSLAGFKVITFASNLTTIAAVKFLRIFGRIDITALRKGALQHPEMLQLFSKARIYLGLSKSDGISTSMLEAMALGAFPIQTDTSCANEWIASSSSGFIVNYLNEEMVRDSLLEALQNDLLVDTAQNSNRDRILKSYTTKHMETQVIALYQQTLALDGGSNEPAS
jgi:hypothetical protein